MKLDLLGDTTCARTVHQDGLSSVRHWIWSLGMLVLATSSLRRTRSARVSDSLRRE